MSRGWLTAARMTNAQWIAVSVFEDVIALPERIAREQGTGVLAPESPARYHVPTAPLVLGSAAVAAARTDPGSARRWALVAAGSTGVAAILTGVLVGGVTVPLLTGRAEPENRPRLAARWHRVNRARILTLLGAGAAFHRAARAQRRAP